MGVSQNRRSEERVSISQLVLMGMFREEWIHARGIDLSRTGFRFRSPEEVETGSEIFVQLDVDGEQVAAWAVVIHTRPVPDGEGQEAGCEFTRFQGNSRAQLEAYLATLES